MLTSRKAIRMVAAILCALGMAPVTSCIAQVEWDKASPITLDIKRSAQQVWHPIGRTVILQAVVSDPDNYRDIGSCSWNTVTWRHWWCFNFSWTGSTHLIPPTNGSEVSWRAKQHTPEAHTITLTVNDNTWTSLIIDPDTGECDDPDATDSRSLGAFDVKASLTVSGTGHPPSPPMYTLWSEHDESLHYDDPDWVEAAPPWA